MRAASNATLPPPTTTTRLAEVDAEAPVDVEEELDGAQDAVELVAGQIQVASPAGADREEECVVAAEAAPSSVASWPTRNESSTSMPSSRMASISRAMSPRGRRYSGMPSTIIPPSRSAAS